MLHWIQRQNGWGFSIIGRIATYTRVTKRKAKANEKKFQWCIIEKRCCSGWGPTRYHSWISGGTKGAKICIRHREALAMWILTLGYSRWDHYLRDVSIQDKSFNLAYGFKSKEFWNLLNLFISDDIGVERAVFVTGDCQLMYWDPNCLRTRLKQSDNLITSLNHSLITQKTRDKKLFNCFWG